MKQNSKRKNGCLAGELETMRLVRVQRPGAEAAWGIVEDGQVFQVSPEGGAAGRFLATLLEQPEPVQALRELRARGGAPLGRLDELAGAKEGPRLLAPIEGQEVWAAGVTYQRSKVARMEESAGAASFYDKVYDADRPELFLKATPSRVSGPGAAVRIRQDARWNVPEPEVALLVSPALKIVGYTVGNDMSSRDIEGENPLYLPQAKVYAQCCGLGPAILLEEEGRSHRDFPITLRIERDGQLAYSGETSTAQMKRTFGELVEWLGRDNVFADGVFLLTGTGLVPGDDFTLEHCDRVSITVPEIGTLTNVVCWGGREV